MHFKVLGNRVGNTKGFSVAKVGRPGINGTACTTTFHGINFFRGFHARLYCTNDCSGSELAMRTSIFSISADKKREYLFGPRIFCARYPLIRLVHVYKPLDARNHSHLRSCDNYSSLIIKFHLRTKQNV